MEGGGNRDRWEARKRVRRNGINKIRKEGQTEKYIWTDNKKEKREERKKRKK